jgi:hypothetical protein
VARLPVGPRGAGPRRLPWKTVLAIAMWLAERGRERWARLSRREQQELTRMVRVSRGRRGNLTAREQADLRRLVWKALGPDGG